VSSEQAAGRRVCACRKNARRSTSFCFEHRGLGFICTYSRFPDGRIGELFITNHKVASAVDVDARDAAIILSFALQHGADILAIAKALSRDPRGTPTGVMGTVLDRLLAEGEGF
jgi:hypothetical protein